MNKIRFGLCNTHIASVTYNTATDSYTYGTPRRLPGSVSMSFDADVAEYQFYADNGIYFSQTKPNGFSGTFEIADVPDWFKVDYLGYKRRGGGLVLSTDAHPKEFVLMTQIDGDENAGRIAFYRCSCGFQSEGSSTTDSSATIKTQSITIKIMPRVNDGEIKYSVENVEGSTTAYNNFFNAVAEPTTFKNCDLKAMALTGVTLVPDFSMGELNYNVSTNATSSTISATCDDSSASVAFKKNGTAVQGGALTFTKGETATVTAIVTNGDDSLTYTIVVDCHN